MLLGGVLRQAESKQNKSFAIQTMQSRTKASGEQASSNHVQVFSALTEMRYKPASQNGTQIILKNNQRLGKKGKELVQLYDPVTMTLQPSLQNQSDQRRLKFLASLSSEHFIVGNENQIDMVGFGTISHGYVDTEYHWSLSLKGPIESICVDSRKSMFLILSGSTIYFYQYNLKSREPPEATSELAVKQGVRFVRFLKDLLLGVFYSTNYEIYNIQNINAIKKKSQKNYNVGKQKKLLTIPTSIDYIINIFFEEPKQRKQSFILWCLEINFEGQIKTKEPYRVYDIMNHAKEKLSVQNYTTDIIFLGIGHQIMAIKNGYLIDIVNLKVSNQSQILKYLHPNTILHINKKNVEVYNFSININVKPEKIVLHTTDSIELKRLPDKVNYMSVLRAFKDNFALFFEDSLKKKIQTRGEITYYFEISQNTTVKDKMNLIFDAIEENINNPQFVDQKYNVAMKMGLSQKEVYLQIWSRSMKCTIEDYQYLLATKDYKIIKTEIEKKLKKESMVLREVIRIEQSCHQINREWLNSTTCTEQNLRDFVSSHFLLKKLQIYKQITALERFSIVEHENAESGSNLKQMKIDVHNYFYYKNADVKLFLLDLINDMLFNLKNNAKIIRIVLKNFKFHYRLVYKEILADIIITAKDSLIDLLNQLPELLPFTHQDLNNQQLKEGLYGGLWGSVNPQQWQKQLYPSKVQTLYNRETVKDFLRSIWFKRYYLTSHGLTTKNEKEIQKINEYNNSDKIFYYFISHLYDHFKTNKPLYFQLIHFLEQKYELYPSHLKGKAPLYENLYIYYYNEELNNSSRLDFAQFLEWDDQLLFKYFFDHEKVKKNSLLKQIKPIYQQSDSEGDHLFNIGLFSYFFSDISEVSDLKFILNRINNEKSEFHKKNKGIYEVLIRSVQFKIRLGTGKDVPLEEVMIYIQNIQLDENDQILDELFVMDHIKLQTKLFQEMKIDMSIKQIMENYETVMGKIIDYKIEKHLIKKIEQYEQFKEESLKILQELLRIKASIYQSQNSSFLLLGYLSVVMQDEKFIQMGARFLEEGELHDLFELQTTTVENLVMYMYKWSFSISSKYVDNQSYIRKLFDLLPADNEVRRYLETKLAIGILLSSPEEPFQYPLSKSSNFPSAKVISQTFKYNNSQFLLSLDLQKLSSLLNTLEVLIYGEDKNPAPISLHKLYELMIIELLNNKKYQEVIGFIRKILSIESPIKDIGILYLALYILKTAKEFNQESRKCLFKLLALYFYEPLGLLEVLEFSIKTKLTGLEQSNYLRQIIEKEQGKSNFNPDNPIMNPQFCIFYKDPNSKKVIEAYRQFLKSKNKQLQHGSEYDIIFTFLCQSPYLLVKLFYILKKELHYKNLYAFLVMALSRPIFQRKKAYEALKRIFSALTMCSKQMKNSDQFVLSLSSKSLNDEYQLPKLGKVNDYEQKVSKIAKLLQKGIFKLNKSMIKEAAMDNNILMLKKAISNPNQVLEDQFEAQQEDYELNEEEFIKKEKKKKSRFEFNPSSEKQIYFYRFSNLADFLANRQSGKIQKQVSLNLVRKQSAPLVLKAMKSTKDTNYLNTKQQAIEHLYSHKKITGSEINEEDETYRQDEQFLDSFLPKPAEDNSKSKVTLAAIRSSGSMRKSRSKQMHPPKEKLENNERILDLVDKQILIEDCNQPELATKSQIKYPSQQVKMEHLKEQLVKSYIESKIPKFDLAPLEKQLLSFSQSLPKQTSLQSTLQFLGEFFKHLYEDHVSNMNINLKLMEEIARKHPQINVNIFFLQAYQRTYQTNQKLGLDLNIKSFLPLSSIYTKSKDIFDLYIQVEPFIKPQITDENIFKLSKLVALGFRKSIVEQEILCHYLRNLVANYIGASEEDLPEALEKIKNIMHKLQVQVLIDKLDGLFNSLEPCEQKQKIFEICMEWLKNRGYGTAARQIRSKVK